MSAIAFYLVFYYKHLVPLKMGWSENRPHLFWFNVVIKFLCPYLLATIEKGGCAWDHRAYRATLDSVLLTLLFLKQCMR